MSVSSQTIKEITDKVSKQFLELKLAVANIQSDSPDYFPLITGDNDYKFEFDMLPCVSQADNWSLPDLIKASPLPSLINSMNHYFETNTDMSGVGFGGALDNYLYVNGLTVYKYFADAQFYSNGYKMSGILVENTDSFIFAEFGRDSYDTSFFNSLGSYQTDNINSPYGTYSDYIGFAPTDQVEIEIIQGIINFDINLLCKDKNGETFVFNQNIQGVSGEKIKLNLTEKITGCVRLTSDYIGQTGDFLRIQTLIPEV